MTPKEMILCALILFSAVAIIAIVLGTIVHKDVRKELWQREYKYGFIIAIIVLLASLYYA